MAAPFASCGRVGEHSMIDVFDYVLSRPASDASLLSAERWAERTEMRRPAAERPCL
jgi:hypothetical protein